MTLGIYGLWVRESDKRMILNCGVRTHCERPGMTIPAFHREQREPLKECKYCHNRIFADLNDHCIL